MPSKALLPFLKTLIHRTFDDFKHFIALFSLLIAKQTHKKEAMTHFFRQFQKMLIILKFN